MAKPCTLSKTQRSQLETLFDTYKTAYDELAQLGADIRSEWESAIDDKSDRWKEGDAGQEAQDRLDAFDAWVENLVEPEPIPDDLDG